MRPLRDKTVCHALLWGLSEGPLDFSERVGSFKDKKQSKSLNFWNPQFSLTLRLDAHVPALSDSMLFIHFSSSKMVH